MNLMDQRQLGRILQYEPEALKRNIRKHRENIVVFTEHIERAKADIEELEGYLELIEEHERKTAEIARKAEKTG